MNAADKGHDLSAYFFNPQTERFGIVPFASRNFALLECDEKLNSEGSNDAATQRSFL